MIGRSLGKSPNKNSDRITLNFSVSGRPVMIDRIETAALPQKLIAKMEIEKCASSLANELIKRGEKPDTVEFALRKLLGSEKTDLSSICDFLDTAAMFVDRLHRPTEWISRIGSHVSRLSSQKQSIRAYQLFEEARNAQGTDNEPLLIRSLE